MTSKDNNRPAGKDSKESALTEDRAEILKGEIDTNIISLVDSQEQFAARMQELQKQLSEEMNKISRFNLILRQLPEKIEQSLHEQVSTISGQVTEKISKSLFGVLQSQIEAIGDSIEKNKNSLNKLDIDIRALEVRSWRKRLFQSLIVASLVAIISGIVSYTTIRFHPTQVMLDKAGNVSVHNSKITLWRAENLNAPKSSQTRSRR